eukprot:CAMPEP_0168350112 /NCGR_PEP_ID=MMETSP0213-20121227/20893_1 /TAXON_ID=151035 /ORGANISM="Euplotes harpa, Strain FSP1.4" /LENGTH=95 /DNA_ID=CAMNT_0008360333 /DNA_START=380 /DNA_END=667 /DNA_ORIENTATION=-
MTGNVYVKFDNSESAQKCVDTFTEFSGMLFMRLCDFGRVIELIVASNTQDFMAGNVYVKFENAESAQKCVDTFTEFNSNSVSADLTNATNLSEAI